MFEFAELQPSLTLRYVAWYWNRWSPNLTGQAIKFFSGKIPSQSKNRNRQLHRLLPDLQIPERLNHEATFFQMTDDKLQMIVCSERECLPIMLASSNRFSERTVICNLQPVASNLSSAFQW